MTIKMDLTSFKIKILTAAATGAFILSTLSAPAFAQNSEFGNFNFNFFGGGNLNEIIADFFDRRLKTTLDGSQEIPGPGDPDGEGKARVKIDIEKTELCADLEVENIDPATSAHIHHAPQGSAGAVVVVLPTPDSDGESEGCISVNEDLLKAIQDNFEDYYVNVHNTPYPEGAIRGQLAR